MRRHFIYIAVAFVAGLLHTVAAQTWELDKAHSTVGFTVQHMVLSKVSGTFHEFDGQVTFNTDNPAGSKIRGVIKTASIDTDNERRDGHLKSADFFDVEKYPEIVFESTSIKKQGDKYIAEGNLTMRDVTKKIEIPFTVSGPITDPQGNTRIGIEGSTTINRQDYHVSWSRIMDNGGLVVSDEVELNLHAELTRK